MTAAVLREVAELSCIRTQSEVLTRPHLRVTGCNRCNKSRSATFSLAKQANKSHS